MTVVPADKEMILFHRMKIAELIPRKDGGVMS